jgi:amino acid adenylation domain-containing protein
MKNLPYIASLLQVFDQNVRLAPQAIALKSDREYSYLELAFIASKYARSLASKGVSVGDRIAVSVDRGPELLPLLLAIWSLRAAYVPIDPHFPEPRKNHILSHSASRILVCSKSTQLRGDNFESYLISELDSEEVSETNLFPGEYSEYDLAYVIYTSGSTGTPKGVSICQKNVSNFLKSMAVRPGLCSSDTLLAVTTISFDIHVLELFLPLYVGAKVVIASSDQAKNPSALIDLIDRSSVSALQATPATWRMILNEAWIPATPLKMLVGGEAFPVDLIEVSLKKCSEVWNMYGPTETTVWSTCSKVSGENIFIGKAIENTSLYVVDGSMVPVESGEKGELLIGGAGVALGYYRNQDLTDKRFVKLENGERVYRTGDLVRLTESGEIQYINRIDNQIKIRGHRVEPVEIEQTLEKRSDVEQLVVVAADFGAVCDQRLVAIYLGEAVTQSSIESIAREHLPAYMQPQHYVKLNSFPLTDNLKVDRKKLAEMAPELCRVEVKEAAGFARDDRDRSILQVWENALKVSNIGIDDNFFELGGHSLLALQVIKNMYVATGLKVSEADFFKFPTVRECISNSNLGEDGGASVVKLNKEVGDHTVFCLSGVNIYADLAKNIRHPVYGVFAKEEFGIIEGRSEFSIDTLANKYVSAIERQGDFQSVSIIGFSFGGLLSLDVAQILLNKGVLVNKVVLLDSYFSSSFYRRPWLAIYDMLNVFSYVGFRAFLKKAFNKIVEKVKNIDENSGVNTDLIVRADEQRTVAFDNAGMVWESAGKKYVMSVLLIRAEKLKLGMGVRAYPDYGLGRFIIGDITVESVKEEHTGLLAGDGVKSVLSIINRYEGSR